MSKSAMIKMSAKVGKTEYEGNTTLWVYCPACKHAEQILVRSATTSRPSWEWNGDYEKPSFTPSVKITGGPGYCCHYYITDGQFRYQDDCSHDLKGAIVDVPDLPAEWDSWFSSWESDD